MDLIDWRQSKGHDWQPRAGGFGCFRCLKWTAGSVAARQHKPCEGKSRLMQAVEAGNGHSFVVAQSKSDISMVCSTCCCFATSVPRGLLEPCRQRRHRGGVVTLARITAGKHPSQRRADKLVAMWPWRAGHPWAEWCRGKSAELSS